MAEQADVATQDAGGQKGFLGWVERTGNRLPDPVFIFFYLIVALMGLSVLLAVVGVSPFV